MDKMLSVDQVGEVLGVTYKTALRVVNELPHIKVGGKLLRVSESDLQRWIRQKTVQPLAEAVTIPQPRKRKPQPFVPYLDEDGKIPYRKPKKTQTA